MCHFYALPPRVFTHEMSFRQLKAFIKFAEDVAKKMSK